MDIVHVDPGYGRLMDLYSNTKLEYVENSTCNPTSGVAFTTTSGAASSFPNLDFTFEPTTGQFYKKVWSIKFSFYTDGGGFYAGFTSGFHNVSITYAVTADGTGSIPSDDGIPADTPIYRLPLGSPITDFTAGDNGEYIGTANGQTLLQAVNASSLITTHGNRPINHVVAYGAPGYRVGSSVATATGISKSDNTITSHGTHTLSFDKTAHVYYVWAIGDGNTFSDINGLQVGWRAGD